MYDALILAAGYGTRLQPLTDMLPKPLVSFFGAPILYSAIYRLIASNAGKIFINGHHLSHKIENFIDALPRELQQQIIFLHEREIMGTGGPIASAHKVTQQEDLVVYNSDCLHEIPVDQLCQFHQQNQFAATMTLLPSCPPGKNPVYARKGRVIGIGFNENFERDPEVTSHTLAGVHVVGREFRSLIPDGQFFDVRKTYEEFFHHQAGIGAFIYNGPWFDIGEPQDYWLAHEETLCKPDGYNFLKSIGVVSYLAKNKITHHYNFGQLAPRFFTLAKAARETEGDLQINLSQRSLLSENISRVLLLEDQNYTDLESRNIYGHSFHWSI